MQGFELEKAAACALRPCLAWHIPASLYASLIAQAAYAAEGMHYRHVVSHKAAQAKETAAVDPKLYQERGCQTWVS